MKKGRIVRIESKDYYVLSDQDKIVRCYLRGKFQKEFELKKDKLFTLDIAAVGDFVKFSKNEDGTGAIEKIEERKNHISRKAPKIKGASYRGQRLEQIVCANVDNLFIVTSIKKPSFNNRSVDRLLVTAESSHVKPFLIINKVDLDKNDSAQKWKEFYEEIGYTVFVTSTEVEIDSFAKIESELEGKVNLFWGHSGVGKSSILNKIFPELNFKVKKISDHSNKGTHTTVTSRMELVGKDTFIIDTPGIREIDPYGITQENLSHYFNEFVKFIHDCKFNTCTHHHEPGCAVIKAVEAGKISEERYISYLNILDTIEEDLYF
ncbi:MAG: ribosome small subunit-dependent GTPase A [Melioribacteraceae bacterium]|nr:MAG: ribosome small subunit-dependent GTPase A [Melioribacteraceae bacterium]